MIRSPTASPLRTQARIARWRRLGLAAMATLAIGWLVIKASPLIDYPIRSYDSNVYLNAATAVLRGQDPYADPDYRY